MNHFFRRIPLPVKLMLIGLIPLAFLIYLSLELYQEKAEKVAVLKGYIQHINQSARINKLIDELQTERKLSFDYAMKKDGKAVLMNQRPRTDSVINQLKRSRDDALMDFTQYTFLKDLHEVRNKVDSEIYSPDMVMQYYTTTIFRLSTLTGISIESNNYLESVYKDLTSQKLLSKMITYLGIMRSNIYNVLYTHQNALGTLYGLKGVYDVYNTYETEFLLKATPSCAQAYKALLNKTPLKPTIDYLSRTFETYRFDSTYNATQWWIVSANGIDDLRNLQFDLWGGVEARLNKIYRKEQAKKDYTLAFLIIALIIVVLIVSYTLRVITLMLTELKVAAEKISVGASDLQFGSVPRDVIGSLARSISKIDENNRQLAHAANAIGQGYFDVSVKPRSGEDMLGNAIVRMKDNLRQYTEENEEIKERFRQLADFMPQMVWTARSDGYLDYYNKRWYEFTGFREGYGDQSWIPLLHPDDVQYYLDTWYHSVKTGMPYQIEYRFKDRKTSAYKWFLGKAVPIRDEQDQVIKWFGTCTEIQDQKMLSEELERKVKERTRDLRLANMELERSNRDLEQFAYVASHDLQEPVRKIRTFAEYIKDTSYNQLEEHSQKYLVKICASTDRMMSIIKDLLNFASLHRDKDQFKPTDLNKILADVKSDLELIIHQKKAIIQSDPLPVIEAIPVQMNQLFYNLINNSLKFSSKEKPPVIRISTASGRQTKLPGFSNADAANDLLEIRFRDNGVGFEQEYAEQIFAMFQRLNDREAYAGTGIGLAVCKKIVENHNGDISAESALGKGATFRIVLPMNPIETGASPMNPTSTDAASSIKKMGL